MHHEALSHCDSKGQGNCQIDGDCKRLAANSFIISLSVVIFTPEIVNSPNDCVCIGQYGCKNNCENSTHLITLLRRLKEKVNFKHDR